VAQASTERQPPSRLELPLAVQAMTSALHESHSQRVQASVW
jgi:hypothetical protein